MKNIIIWTVVVLILISGGVYVATRNQKGDNTPDSQLSEIKAEEVEVTPATYDIGKVIMKDGLVTREYEIKNKSANTLRLKKVVTSCMCTKAQVVVGDAKTRFYAMEMGGAKNPIISLDIPGNSVAKVIVRFDPAAHGIQGVGPIDRKVFLTFMDPVGTKEVGFSGEVVLK